MVEGAEFLLTHHDLLRRQIGHFLAAAACALGATWLGSRLAPLFPAAPVVAFPWYLVLVEWLWAGLPSVLAAEVVAWGAGTAYLTLPSTRQLILAVMSQRGSTDPSATSYHERGRALAWLAAGAAVYVVVVWVPVVGPTTAAVLACPVLGGGFVVAVLTLRGWPAGAVRSFVGSHWAILFGVGVGVTISLVVPLINLAALPCAAAGTACLLLREARPDVFRTNAGTVPCAWPNR